MDSRFEKFTTECMLLVQSKLTFIDKNNSVIMSVSQLDKYLLFMKATGVL